MTKRIVLAVVIALALIVAGGIAFALHSQMVLRWAVAQVAARYPEFAVQQVTGTLAGPITLGQVQVHGAAFDARIGSITLDWHISALLAKRVSITRLDLKDVDVTLRPGGGAKPFKFKRPRPPQLPVSVSLHALTLEDLRLVLPGLAEPVKVSSAALSARLTNRAWSVRNLEVNGAEVQVSGRGSWRFQTAQQLNAQLQWQLQLPRMPRFAGEASIAGDGQVLRLQGSLQAPFVLQLAGEIHNVFAAPAWSGHVEFSGLDPQRLRASWPEITAQGELALQGDPAGTTMAGDINAREPTYGLLQTHVDLALAGRRLDIRELQLTRKASDTRLDLTGQVLYADGHIEPTLHGDWRALPIPLAGKPWFTSPSGKLSLRMQKTLAVLSVDGTLANGGSFTARGEADTAAPHAWKLTASARKFQVALANFDGGKPLPPVSFEFRGHGDASATNVDQLDATWLGGAIQAHGRLPHARAQTWQFEIAAQHINPGALYPEFPGALNLKARLSGQLPPARSLTLQLAELKGEVHGVPLQASGNVTRRAKVWQFQDLAVTSGKNHLRLDGRYGQGTALTWTLDAPDLATLSPDLQGSVESRGKADFSAGLPNLALTLKAHALQYAAYSVKSLDLDVNLAGASPENHADLKLAAIRLGKLTIDSITGSAAGAPADHTLKLALASPYGRINIAGRGHYANHAWLGDLAQVSLAPKGAGEWKNASVWQLQIAGRHLSLPQACLAQNEARSCLQADWQPGAWLADARITDVPTTDLQALLPQGLTYTGSFGGHLHVQESGGARTLELDANLSPGAVFSVINQHKTPLLAYNAGHLKLHADSQLTTAEFDWTLVDGGYLNVDTQIENDNHLALSGHIKGELRDFQLIPALIPAVGSMRGKLAINLTLSGTPSDPLFDGSAAFTNGTIGIPLYGLNIGNVNLTADGNGRHLTINGSAGSAQGTIKWNSQLTRGANHWQAEGELTGENFRVANTPEMQLDISPALNLKLDNYDINVDGSVTIPHAKIQPRDLSQTAGVSPDQVIVGAKRPPPSKWRVHAKVRAIMGPAVQFDGFGLSGRIAGSVEAVDEPGKATAGNGTLEIVGGKFAAYGQKLNIERGRLLFNGPIANPALDIRAIRPPARSVNPASGATEQKVGVQVRGPLQHPRISLFSQPPLPQSQMMSYLLTGQTGLNQNVSPLVGLPQTGSSDVTQIAGGQLIASELGSQIGVNDVSVQNVQLANGTNAPAVFLGKFLSPRLYVSYGTVLGQSLNTLRIQYTLSTRWMLEAETGFASGADLIYSIER